MKTGWWPVLILLTMPAFAQESAPAATSEEPQHQQTEPERPSLGRAPSPSLRSPRASNIMDRRKLLRVRRVFVEPIDNFLNERLLEGIGKSGVFRIAAERKEADAVIRGTCLDSRRLKQVHCEIYLNDNQGSAIWQDSVRVPFNPPPLAKAMEQTASLVVEHLKESVADAVMQR